MVSKGKVLKLKNRLASVAKRASSAASANDHLLCSLGAAAALTYAEKKGKIPSIMGLDPALVIGGVLYLGGRKLAGGKAGQRIEAAGEGLLAVATSRVVQRGSIKVSGTDIVGDDDDDDDLDD